ncbi:hypothetical protein R0K19_23795, partial [Bacillus sp. SIMBA_161]
WGYVVHNSSGKLLVPQDLEISLYQGTFEVRIHKLNKPYDLGLDHSNSFLKGSYLQTVAFDEDDKL